MRCPKISCFRSSPGIARPCPARKKGGPTRARLVAISGPFPDAISGPGIGPNDPGRLHHVGQGGHGSGQARVFKPQSGLTHSRPAAPPQGPAHKPGHLLHARHARAVDVVDPGTDVVGVFVFPEGLQKLILLRLDSMLTTSASMAAIQRMMSPNRCSTYGCGSGLVGHPEDVQPNTPRPRSGRPLIRPPGAGLPGRRPRRSG